MSAPNGRNGGAAKNWMLYAESTTVTWPATLERPRFVLTGPKVEELPEQAAVGDLVVYNGKLWAFTGKEA